MRKTERLPFYLQTLVAMFLGIALGYFGGPALSPLGKAGSALIQVIKALATPLLFLVLVDSFVHAQIQGKWLATLTGICLINSLCALIIGLGISNIFLPGTHLTWLINTPLSSAPAAKADLGATVLGYIPENIFQPFLTHSVPGVIVLAVLLGLGLRGLRKEGTPIDQAARAIHLLTQTTLHALAIVVRLSPIAVLAVTAAAVGTKGISPFKGLTAYVLCTVAGMCCQVIFVYPVWIRWLGKIPMKTFWAHAKEPVLYSFGVNSSLASLPLTFKALENLRISPTAARTGAGLGTNFNNDGILLYEAMAVLIVAQAYGVSLSFASQLSIAFTCVVATFGVAGVPEAGIVALTLVLSAAGLPAEILPLFLTVDWIVARCRSATNVVSDLTVSIALDAIMSRRRNL